MDHRLKSFVSRPVCILFQELEELVPTLHMASVCALLSKFPKAQQVASAHLTFEVRDFRCLQGPLWPGETTQIRDAAKNSIGSRMPAKSLKLKHTILLIRELDNEIAEIESEVNSFMEGIHSPITTIIKGQ